MKLKCEIEDWNGRSVLRCRLTLQEYNLIKAKQLSELYIDQTLSDAYMVSEVHIVAPSVSFDKTIIFTDFNCVRWSGYRFDEQQGEIFKKRHNLQMSEYDGFDWYKTNLIIALGEPDTVLVENEVRIRNEVVKPQRDTELVPRKIDDNFKELRNRYLAYRNAEIGGDDYENLQKSFNSLFEDCFRCRYIVKDIKRRVK